MNDAYSKISDSTRLPELDMLRASAILLVLGRHTLVIPADLPIPVKKFFFLWRRIGWIGVDLFFVLSGFLVSGLIFREIIRHGNIHPWRFLVRRGLKIYPPFYVFIVCSLFLIPVLGSHVPRQTILGEIFFLQNYVGSMWNHTWSLAIEEHFYLGLLLVSLTIMHLSPHNFERILRFLSIAVCIGLASVRIYLVYGRGWEWGRIHSLSHFRIDSLLFGVFLSIHWNYRRVQMDQWVNSERALIAILALLLLSPAFFFDIENSPIIPAFAFTSLYLGFGLLLILIITLPNSSAKSKILKALSPLASIGKHSYSIYLWHMAVFSLSILLTRKLLLPINIQGAHAFYIQIPVYIVGSLALGISYSRILEQPILKIRDKIFPSRSRIFT